MPAAATVTHLREDMRRRITSLAAPPSACFIERTFQKTATAKGGKDMKRHGMASLLTLLSVAALVLALSPLAALAQGQGGGGGGNGSGKPPSGEESTMNLSYPANFFETSPQSGTIGTYTLGAALGGGMSYGCAVPETIGTSTYPNTSCVDDEGKAQDYNTCLARCTLLQTEPKVERIYWQKNLSNKWQAGYLTSNDAIPAEYIDWGDNLEGKTWPVQVLRVETNTFSTLPEPVEGLDIPRTRFEMWHVYGQGTNELWGVHATDADPPVPYLYFDTSDVLNWPFAVNVAAGARLNIAKLHHGSATCPSTATGQTQSPYRGEQNLVWFFDYVTMKGSWVDAPYDNDLLYGAELNIKGSYVFGYNWNLRSDPVPEIVDKAGWWRLTFYTPGNSIDFSSWVEPTAEKNTLAPPVSSEVPLPISTPEVELLEESESSLLLYVPQVDQTNHLTYLDVCIQEGKAGGGGGGGGNGGGHGPF